MNTKTKKALLAFYVCIALIIVYIFFIGSSENALYLSCRKVCISHGQDYTGVMDDYCVCEKSPGVNAVYETQER